MAVVDPTFGHERRAIAIVNGWGEVFVGPDNGLLIPAAERSGGIRRAHQISELGFLLRPISRTFQGRDVFAPATAHIANGVDPVEMGPEVDVKELVRLEVPEAWPHDDHLHAEVLQVDRFGNLQLNFGRVQLEEVGLDGSEFLEVRLEGHRLTVPIATTYADVDTGDYVLVEDSYRHFSLSVNKGDARAQLRGRAGSTVIVGPTSS
jgi:S-adenosylmethionine hydrolase